MPRGFCPAHRHGGHEGAGERRLGDGAAAHDPGAPDGLHGADEAGAGEEGPEADGESEHGDPDLREGRADGVDALARDVIVALGAQASDLTRATTTIGPVLDAFDAIHTDINPNLRSGG